MTEKCSCFNLTQYLLLVIVIYSTPKMKYFTFMWAGKEMTNSQHSEAMIQNSFTATHPLFLRCCFPLK